MAVIQGNLVEDNKIKVMSVAYLSDDTSGGGYQFDSIPEYPAARVGINQVMYANPLTKEIWFEEEARELTDEELESNRIVELEGAVMELTSALATLMGGGN